MCANAHVNVEIHIVSAARGLLQAVSLTFSLFRMYFSLSSSLIRMIHGLRSAHRGTSSSSSSSSSVKYQFIFSYALPLFSMYQVLAVLALKGNGKPHRDWLYLCSAQNKPMTNSESKYHLFVPCDALCAQIICCLTS